MADRANTTNTFIREGEQAVSHLHNTQDISSNTGPKITQSLPSALSIPISPPFLCLVPGQCMQIARLINEPHFTTHRKTHTHANTDLSQQRLPTLVSELGEPVSPGSALGVS